MKRLNLNVVSLLPVKQRKNQYGIDLIEQLDTAIEIYLKQEQAVESGLCEIATAIRRGGDFILQGEGNGLDDKSNAMSTLFYWAGLSELITDVKGDNILDDLSNVEYMLYACNKMKCDMAFVLSMAKQKRLVQNQHKIG